MMTPMKLFVIPLVVGPLVQMLASTARADDAYDDEDAVQRPEDDRDDEEQEGEGKGPLQSGGLAAPGTLGDPDDGRSDIEKELERSDEKDAGRGLEFVWLSGEIGFQTLGLATFSGSSGVASEQATGSGLVYGGALGMRVLYFTLGARFRMASMGDLSPWSLLGEGALRIPLGKLEPYAVLGGGYTKMAGLPDSERVGGIDLRLGGGLDYYFSDSFSVGACLTGDVLFLSNDGASSTGAALTTSLQLGLHF